MEYHTHPLCAAFFSAAGAAAADDDGWLLAADEHPLLRTYYAIHVPLPLLYWCAAAVATASCFNMTF